MIFFILAILLLKKIGDCKNIHSVNPLYLIFQSAAGYFEEKNGEKHLILDSTEKYDELFSAIKSQIETINGGEKMHYEKNYAKLELIQMMNTYE